MGRRGGLGGRCRRTPRRRPHAGARMGVGAVGERPRLVDRPRPDARSDSGEPLGVGDASLRCRRSCERHGGTLRPGLCATRRQQCGVELDEDRQPARAVGRPDRRVRRDRAALEGPSGSVPDLPAQDPHRRQHRRDPARRLAVLDVLLHLPLHAAGARVQRDSRRTLLPAAGSDDHRRGRPGWTARHAIRVQAGPGRGDGLRRPGTPLVQPRLRRGRLPH